jgi:hypothetical protein
VGARLLNYSSPLTGEAELRPNSNARMPEPKCQRRSAVTTRAPGSAGRSSSQDWSRALRAPARPPAPRLPLPPVFRTLTRLLGAGAAGLSDASLAARLARFCWWRLPCARQGGGGGGASWVELSFAHAAAVVAARLAQSYICGAHVMGRSKGGASVSLGKSLHTDALRQAGRASPGWLALGGWPQRKSTRECAPPC